MSTSLFANLSNLCSFLQYPDYIDAYLRLAAIAKARNNVHISLELVVIAFLAISYQLLFISYKRFINDGFSFYRLLML